jgi:hypothetical protein
MSAYKTASTLSGATGITGTGRSALLKLSATIVLLWVVGTAVAENPLAPVVT